jgi:hypothetical protein
MKTPPDFPISFDEMLALLMPQVDKAADRLARFRHYLIAARTGSGQKDPPPDADERAAETIGRYRARDREQGGRAIGNIYFYAVAEEFNRWWVESLAQSRRRAGASAKRVKKTPRTSGNAP